LYLDESPQRHSSQRGSDIHIVEAQAYCLPMELASLLKVTFGLVLLVSQSLTQQALQRLAFDQGIHIPRDQVRDVMRLHEPEGFECRNPGSRKVHRTPIVPLRIHERWTADGHDKLYSIGFPIWAILDFGSQKALGAWVPVVPSNRLAIVIAYLFLCVVEKYRGLCSSIQSIIIKLIFLLFRNTLGDIHRLWIGDNAVIWLC